MDTFAKYKIQAMFNTVHMLIENKQEEISEKRIINLDNSIHFLNDVINSLNSLNDTSLSSENNNAYCFTPNLREIISIKDSETIEFSPEIIDGIKSYFQEIVEKINSLKCDPKEFYSSEDSTELNNFIHRIIDIFTENPINIENDYKMSTKLVLGF